MAITETFAPRYSWGNPVTSTSTETVASTTNLKISSVFSRHSSAAPDGALSTTDPAVQLVARGIYDRATNTFTATAIDFAL